MNIIDQKRGQEKRVFVIKLKIPVVKLTRIEEMSSVRGSRILQIGLVNV